MSDDRDALDFAERVGQHFARRHSLPPLTGRVLGWLLVCEPDEKTAAELCAELSAGRSSMSTALAQLEGTGFVRRARRAGERVDRVRVDPGAWTSSLDAREEYATLAELAGLGLDAIAGSPPARRARLLELEAFATFLGERIPALLAEWAAHREELHRTGRLPRADDERRSR